MEKEVGVWGGKILGGGLILVETGSREGREGRRTSSILFHGPHRLFREEMCRTALPAWLLLSHGHTCLYILCT